MQILYQKFKIAKITSDRARHFASEMDIHNDTDDGLQGHYQTYDARENQLLNHHFQTPVKTQSRAERARHIKPGSPGGLMPGLTSLPSMPELTPSAEQSLISKQGTSRGVPTGEKLHAVKSMKHLMAQKKLSEVV